MFRAVANNVCRFAGREQRRMFRRMVYFVYFYVVKCRKIWDCHGIFDIGYNKKECAFDIELFLFIFYLINR